MKQLNLRNCAPEKLNALIDFLDENVSAQFVEVTNNDALLGRGNGWEVYTFPEWPFPAPGQSYTMVKNLLIYDGRKIKGQLLTTIILKWT